MNLGWPFYVVCTRRRRPLANCADHLTHGPSQATSVAQAEVTSVGKPALIKVLPDQPGDVPRTCANIDKARELLGYAPKVTFEEGIRRTVAWYNEWMATKAKAAAVKAAAAGEGEGEGENEATSAVTCSAFSSTGSGAGSDPAGALAETETEGGVGGNGAVKVRQAGSRVRRVASAVSVFSTGGLSG